MAIYQTTEYDENNEFEWDSIQYTIEDGVVISTRTQFDAGYQAFGTYVDGALTQEFYVNTLDALGFQNRSINYDGLGQITYRGTVYPDDYRIGEYFEDGVRTESILRDGFFGDGAKTWDEITFDHDAEGNIIARQITMDDGTLIQDTFEAGVRETRQDFDQTKSWETIDTEYDNTGDVAVRTTTFDTGVVQQIFYQGGQRTQVVQTDTVQPGGSSAKSWTSVDAQYGPENVLMERVTDYDNGILKTELFSNGTRSSIVQEDLENAKTWTSITANYGDQGVLVERRVERDNGDATVNLYVDGDRTQMIQLDGDDSVSWLVRVTDYQPDGTRAVTKYTSADELPETVLAYFPDLAPVVERTELVLDFDDGVSITDGSSIFDGAIDVDISRGQYNVQGILTPNEYGITSGDSDLEAFNSWGATVGFSCADGDTFDFASVSLANSSRADNASIPEDNWANTVTLNGYVDGTLVHSTDIDLTFDHVTHDIDWQNIDQIEFVASGGAITNDYVENAGWFSMDDLTFLV